MSALYMLLNFVFKSLQKEQKLFHHSLICMKSLLTHAAVTLFELTISVGTK